MGRLKRKLKKDEKPSIFIATPAYGGQVTISYLTSLLNTTFSLAQEEINFEVRMLGNESLIIKGRDMLTGMFMRTDHTHILFLDADVQWHPEDVLRLIAHDKEVICGAYPKKVFPLEYPIQWVWEEEGQSIKQKDGIAEIKNAGAGFLLIKREVIEKLNKAHPELKYTTFDYGPRENVDCYSIWDTIVKDEEFYGEDQAFMERWRALGGKVYLDLAINLNHVGSHTFKGDMIKLFKDKSGV